MLTLRKGNGIEAVGIAESALPQVADRYRCADQIFSAFGIRDRISERIAALSLDK